MRKQTREGKYLIFTFFSPHGIVVSMRKLKINDFNFNFYSHSDTEFFRVSQSFLEFPRVFIVCECYPRVTLASVIHGAP
jgi:hypothetical protein